MEENKRKESQMEEIERREGEGEIRIRMNMLLAHAYSMIYPMSRHDFRKLTLRNGKI